MKRGNAAQRMYIWTHSVFRRQTSMNNMAINGTGSPVLVSGQYEYTVAFPPFIATQADSGHRYRIVVATTVPNLSDPNCSSTSGSDYTTLNVIPCFILPVNLVNWTGSVYKNKARLKWLTDNEDEPATYMVEKSLDGIHFSEVGSLPGRYQEKRTNTYNFEDPIELQKQTFYRLKVIGQDGVPTYSKIVLLQPLLTNFTAQVLENPFQDQVRINIQAPQKGKISIQLLDISGRILQTTEQEVQSGTQIMVIKNMSALAPGIYLLHMTDGHADINIKLIKEK